MDILEICKLFEEKSNQYIDKLDQLYGYLLEPFISFDVFPKTTDIKTIPKPEYLDKEDNSSEEIKLPKDLFDP